ncbi:hypothetical protein Patl1_11493 [Pistacia atlantica]|uniref:Uncharacterized protein n=1 Tax=Pistacia atlantica TaxID=434234 RepID=A0ACC1A8G8_9ROSI|nr:hypothetical protein Patl1_11493 [Pistacia atlantica]
MALSLWDQYTDLQHYFNPEMLSFQPPAAGEFEDDFDYYFNFFRISNNIFDISDHQYFSSSSLPDNFIFPLEDFESPPPLPEFLPEISTPPLAGFSFEKSSSTESTDHESSTKKLTGVSLSAQSIAARQRRRKITEKTQELGKLIPGSHRMNTAKMFQAASKYIKFLQAKSKFFNSWSQ